MKRFDDISEGFKDVASVVVLVLAMLFSFSTNFWGLDFRDTFYIGCKYAYGDVDVFTPLTQGIFKLVLLIVGNYILPLRILNWLTYFSACFLFYYLVYVKGRMPKRTRLLLLAMSVFSIPLTDMLHVFNGNSLTVLGVTGIFVSMKLYFDGEKKWLLGIVAFLTISILARFPNVVLVPVLLVFTPLLCRKSSDYLYLMIALVLSIVICLIVNMIVFGGLDSFVDKLTTAFVEASTSESANHSVGLLFQEYLHTLKDMMSDVKYLSVIIAVPLVPCFVRGKMKGIAFPVLFMLALVAFAYLKEKVGFEVFSYVLLVFCYSLILVLVYVTVVVSLSDRDVRALGWNVLPLLLSVCAASGSDTGLILMGGPMAVFAPYIMNKTKPMVDDVVKSKKFVIALSLAGLSLGSFFYCRNGMMIVGIGMILAVLALVWFLGNRLTFYHRQRYSCDGKGNVLYCMIFAVVLYCGLLGYSKVAFSVHDRPLLELTCQQDELLLKGILTNTVSRDFVNVVMAEYRSLGTDNVVFFGNVSAVFSYLLGKGLIPGVNFMQDDTQSNIDAVEKVVDDNPIVFLCPQNPAIGGYTQGDYSRLNTMLINKGYHVEKREHYFVYFPTSE